MLLCESIKHMRNCRLRFRTRTMFNSRNRVNYAHFHLPRLEQVVYFPIQIPDPIVCRTSLLLNVQCASSRARARLSLSVIIQLIRFKHSVQPAVGRTANLHYLSPAQRTQTHTHTTHLNRVVAARCASARVKDSAYIAH